MKKPFLTKLNIVVIVILLLVGVISLFTHIMVTKDSLLTSAGNNLCNVIKEDSNLLNLLDNKKVPKETLDYISENECRNVTVKIFDNLYGEKDIVIDEIDIRLIIRNSILKYETLNDIDIYNNIEEDLIIVSKNITSEFNNTNNYSEIKVISDVTGYYSIPFIVVLILVVLLIVKEKENSPLIIGLLFSGVSFAGYYILVEVPKMLYKHISIVRLFNIDLSIKTEEIATNICCVILIIGLFALTIYVVAKVRKLYWRSRTAYLDKYY